MIPILKYVRITTEKLLFEKKCDHRAADLSALLNAVDASKELETGP